MRRQRSRHNRRIRVTGCHDCPYADSELHGQWFCIQKTGYKVTMNVMDKTFPDNCPLEEEQNDQPSYNHNEAFELAKKLGIKFDEI